GRRWGRGFRFRGAAALASAGGGRWPSSTPGGSARRSGWCRAAGPGRRRGGTIPGPGCPARAAGGAGACRALIVLLGFRGAPAWRFGLAARAALAWRFGLAPPLHPPLLGTAGATRRARSAKQGRARGSPVVKLDLHPVDQVEEPGHLGRHAL